jgi:protein SCO1/2
MRFIAIAFAGIILISSCTDADTSESAGEGEVITEQPADGRLPYLGQYDEVMKEVDGQRQAVREYEVLPHISLHDQNGQPWSTAMIAGKPYVVYFFFTKCPGICPAMTNQMKRLQALTSDIEDLHYIGVSIDPKTDSASTLTSYMQKYGISDRNWHFVYGDKQTIQQLGYAYKANVMESDDPASGGYLHSEHFLLIDGERYLRGIYNGVETADVDRLEAEIRVLMNEKDTWNK